MTSVRGGPLLPLMMVNLPRLLSTRACRAHACPRPDTDTRLSWRRKTKRVSPPVARPGPLRNSEGVGVDAAVSCVRSDRDLTAPPGDCGLDLSMTSEGVSSGKISDSLGPTMLVEEVAASRDNVQADLSRVPGQSLRGKLNKGKRCLPNMTEQGPHCAECRGVCIDPAHDISSLTPLDELSQNELGGSPAVASPDPLNSAGTRVSSQCTLARIADSLAYQITVPTLMYRYRCHFCHHARSPQAGIREKPRLEQTVQMSQMWALP
jgi:hypothetical protein